MKSIVNIVWGLVMYPTEIFALSDANQDLADFRTKLLPQIKMGKKCHFFPGHALDDFISNKFSTRGDRVVVYNPCLSTYNLGNSLGNYFNILACAITVNISLIIGTLTHEYPSMPLEYKGEKGHMLEKYSTAFFESLPRTMRFSDIVPHRSKQQQQQDIESIDKGLREKCGCAKYCWSDPLAPWVSYVSTVRSIMVDALKYYYLSQSAAVKRGLVLRREYGDFSSADASSGGGNSTTFLPYIPDVVIHFRCGDIVPSTQNGFLPFSTIYDLIPFDATYVYILTDDPARARVLTPGLKFTMLCKPIVRDLVDYILRRRQSKRRSVVDSASSRMAAAAAPVVVVKHGGDPFADYLRIARSRVAICAASTFSLWPAIASSGQAYFPATNLVCGGKPGVYNLPNFGPNFKWIYEPRIITEFQDDTSLTQALQVLRRKPQQLKIS